MPDVKTIREALGTSQSEFCDTVRGYGFLYTKKYFRRTVSLQSVGFRCWYVGRRKGLPCRHRAAEELCAHGPGRVVLSRVARRGSSGVSSKMPNKQFRPSETASHSCGIALRYRDWKHP
jgi:hypothetical protein